MKAKQLLGGTDAAVTERLYFKQKPSIDEVRELAALLPGGARDILSTRSRKYKELGLAQQSLTDEELIALLAQEPGLWRRPIVIRNGRAVVGFDAKNLEALLS
ncbi:MAG TPA: ArsC/Spx/MgsR family protein [Symbiobacteriaceae bacterium]|nr:ArsC/Spx/MgsR family protein [Symbiobacteriaceae bacterium]